MYTVIFLLGLLSLACLYILLRKRPKRSEKIPGPKGWPLVGFAPYVKKGKEHEIFACLADEYGEICKISMFGQTLIILSSAQLIREAFSSERYRKFMNGRAATFYGEYFMFGSQGIAFARNAYGTNHGKLRKVFARGMNVYGEGKKAFEEKVMSELVKLNSRLQRFDGKDFEMTAVFSRSLTNIMSVLLGGHDLDDDDKDINMFWDFIKGNDFLLGADVNLVLSTFPFLRIIPGKIKKTYEETNRAKEAIIRRYYYEKKASYRKGHERGFVDSLITVQVEARNQGQSKVFTDETLIAVMLETVAAGTLTTLCSLSNLFLCCLNYPEYQAKIHDELDRVVGKDRLPTFEDRQSCVLIEAGILEAQRYITTVPLGLPHLCTESVEFEGFEIPSKSLIIPNVWYVHHKDEVWGDPWNFRPERWIDETGNLLPNDHILRTNWLPFSVGRRQCPGESLARSRIFLYVATLLQKWKFEVSPEHAVSCDPRLGHFNFDLNCRTKPFMCRVVPRPKQPVSFKGNV